MANSPVTQYGNVLLIDPNLVNVNTEMPNSIPPYQDMFIFAELTAKRRGRTEDRDARLATGHGVRAEHSGHVRAGGRERRGQQRNKNMGGASKI